MSFSPYTTSLVNYLQAKKISYELVSADNLTSNTYIRAVLFKDQEGYLLAILPANCILDVINVGRDLGRELKVVEPNKSPYAKFYDHNLETYCPFTDLIDVSAVIEQHFEQYITNQRVFLPYGDGTQYILMALADFKQLQANIWEVDLAVKIPDYADDIGLQRLQTRISETAELPLMPPIASQLLKIKSSDSAETAQLSKLVEQDPSLVAQLIGWACSPYYGYKGKITSVNDAIINVLGFDLVINIALGLAISQKIRIPVNGPLGLKAYWKKAIYTASLVEKLIHAMPSEYRSLRGMGYLCGLLHNFGRLLVGQLFPAQFEMLNQLAYANPSISILVLEQYLLRIDEDQIGQWLMRSWSMPLEVQLAVSLHNQIDYSGEHAIYIDLIIVAKALLEQYGLCHAVKRQILPLDKIKAIHLQADALPAIMESFKNQTQDLDRLVNLLSGA